jgi:hypothetical protein
VIDGSAVLGEPTCGVGREFDGKIPRAVRHSRRRAVVSRSKHRRPPFHAVSEFWPSGDQPQAIDELPVRDGGRQEVRRAAGVAVLRHEAFHRVGAAGVERLRHSATWSLLTCGDVIVMATVSCDQWPGRRTEVSSAPLPWCDVPLPDRCAIRWP